jgi:hypothetical protein
LAVARRHARISEGDNGLLHSVLVAPRPRHQSTGEQRRRRSAGASGCSLGLFESSLPQPQARFLASQTNRSRTNAGILAGATHCQPRSCILETAVGQAACDMTLIVGVHLGFSTWGITGGGRQAGCSSVEYNMRSRTDSRGLAQPVLEPGMVGAPDHDQQKVSVQNGRMDLLLGPDHREVSTRMNGDRSNECPRVIDLRHPDAHGRGF